MPAETASKSQASGSSARTPEPSEGNGAKSRPQDASSGNAEPTKPISAKKKLTIEKVPQSRSYLNKVGLASLPTQKEAWCKKRGVQFTMILAGCRGTGKTTFLNTLIGEDVEKENTVCEPMQVRDRKYFLQEDKFDMDLTVVDMPDFGVNIDNQNTWLPLVKYIEYQYRSYLVQEEQPVRGQLKDNRVHVCVYFISPTNTKLSSLDIESMREISKRASLVPVIARSDTLNKEELYNFKGIINETLKENNIEVCKYLNDAFAMEKIQAHSPYAIIGSNMVYKNPDGKLVRARKYGWGMVEVDNSEHCDFVHIRELLMSEHLLDLICAMETHYNVFRQKFLRQRVNSTRTLNSSENHSLTSVNGEEDGIASYLMYKKTLGVDDMVLLEKYSGEEESLQQEAKTHLEEAIRKQEAKFREYKAALYTKQKIYNNDLEENYQIVKRLERDIQDLSPDDKEVLKDIAQKVGLVVGGPNPTAQAEDTLATGLTITF